MARIRTVKPEFFRHRRLYLAEKESRLPLRIAFAGLWTCADREGRFQWEPEELKLDCLPYDEVDFSRVLDALATRGFVVKYESGGRVFGAIPGFKRHQVVNNRERESEIPEPPKNASEVIDITTREPRVDVASATRHDPALAEGKGREGNKEQGTSKGRAALAVIPEGLDPKVWQDFTAIRKAKRSPLTETALDGIRREALKAGVSLEQGLRTCCERGWQSLKAEWISGSTEPDYSELIARLKD